MKINLRTDLKSNKNQLKNRTRNSRGEGNPDFQIITFSYLHNPIFFQKTQ